MSRPLLLVSYVMAGLGLSLRLYTAV